MVFNSLPRPLVALGLAGMAPQAICLALIGLAPDWRWVALAAACFYAALILSFLGGLWWMAVLMNGAKPRPACLLGVVPSLAAWAALLPWTAGWAWPGPSLVALGLLLLASPLADRWLSRHVAFPEGWLKLRCAMATGLGLLTLAAAAA